MTTQAEKALDHLAARLKGVDLDELIKAGRQLLARDRMPSTPDGYPSGGDGGSGNGTNTAVEASVFARERRSDDPVHEAAKRYLKALDGLVADIDSVNNALRSITKPTTTEANCELHARIGAKVLARYYRNPRSVFDGSRHLCGPCFNFCDNHGIAPTDEQVTFYERAGVWKYRRTTRTASVDRLALGTEYRETA